MTLDSRGRALLLLSPVLLIALGFGTATLFRPLVGEWAWVPLALVYWGAIAALVAAFRPRPSLAAAWLRRPTRVNVWTVLALVFSLVPLSILAMNVHLFDSVGLVVLWLLFAFVNPWFEEFYWRGLLLDNLPFRRWINVVVSTAFFVLSHPLMWGVFSIGNRSWHVFLYLGIIGVLWAVTYYTTRSLRWVLVSHVVVDLGNLSVLVFLNIYVPPGM